MRFRLFEQLDSEYLIASAIKESMTDDPVTKLPGFREAFSRVQNPA
jgi:hypothetical protein